MNDLYEQSNDFIPSELRSFVAENIDLYGIKIHPAGDKSTISNITDGKKGEVYIHCIGRETSKTAFDINTSFSDEESKILLNKTECILKAVNSELEQINLELNDEQLSEEDRKYKESYKKKLVRYKKFSTCAVRIMIMPPNLAELIILVNSKYCFIQNLIDTMKNYEYLC